MIDRCKTGNPPPRARVNFRLVIAHDQTALECDSCGELFFDHYSAGEHPRLLSSGIPRAIDHARTKHQSFSSFKNSTREKDNCLEAPFSPNSADVVPRNEPR